MTRWPGSHMLSLNSVSLCHLWRQNVELDGLLARPSRAHLMITVWIDVTDLNLCCLSVQVFISWLHFSFYIVTSEKNIFWGLQCSIIFTHSEYLQFMEKQSKANPIAGQSIPVRYDEVKENYSLSRCPSSASSLSDIGITLQIWKFYQVIWILLNAE